MPGDVLDGHTFAEFYGVWCNGGESRARHNPSSLRDQINKRRAAKGLPPMKPTPTPNKG